MIPSGLLEQVKQGDKILYQQNHPGRTLPWYSGVVIEVRKITDRGVTVRLTDKRVNERTQRIDVNGNIAIVTERILLGQEQPDGVLPIIDRANSSLCSYNLAVIKENLSAILENYRPLTPASLAKYRK